MFFICLFLGVQNNLLIFNVYLCSYISDNNPTMASADFPQFVVITTNETACEISWDMSVFFPLLPSRFKHTGYVTNIDYTSGRRLNKALIHRLAGCGYIAEYHNLFIIRATGSGKSYTACALGMKACRHYYNTRYVRLPDFLLDLRISRKNNSYKKTMAKYANPILLIPNEWLLN